jgi:hypothetical protein
MAGPGLKPAHCPSAARHLLQCHPAHLLILGTSHDSHASCQALRIGRETGIKPGMAVAIVTVLQNIADRTLLSRSRQSLCSHAPIRARTHGPVSKPERPQSGAEMTGLVSSAAPGERYQRPQKTGSLPFGTGDFLSVSYLSGG